MDGRETEKTDDKKGESDDAGKDDSKEKTPLVEPEKVSYMSHHQPPRSPQPGHPFVGRRNEYQPKSGDALWLGSKGRYGSCVDGR